MPFSLKVPSPVPVIRHPNAPATVVALTAAAAYKESQTQNAITRQHALDRKLVIERIIPIKSYVHQSLKQNGASQEHVTMMLRSHYSGLSRAQKSEAQHYDLKLNNTKIVYEPNFVDWAVGTGKIQIVPAQIKPTIKKKRIGFTASIQDAVSDSIDSATGSEINETDNLQANITDITDPPVFLANNHLAKVYSNIMSDNQVERIGYNEPTICSDSREFFCSVAAPTPYQSLPNQSEIIELQGYDTPFMHTPLAAALMILSFGATFFVAVKDIQKKIGTILEKSPPKNPELTASSVNITDASLFINKNCPLDILFAYKAKKLTLEQGVFLLTNFDTRPLTAKKARQFLLNQLDDPVE